MHTRSGMVSPTELVAIIAGCVLLLAGLYATYRFGWLTPSPKMKLFFISF
jgi:hypothetical protein